MLISKYRQDGSLLWSQLWSQDFEKRQLHAEMPFTCRLKKSKNCIELRLFAPENTEKPMSYIIAPWIRNSVWNAIFSPFLRHEVCIRHAFPAMIKKISVMMKKYRTRSKNVELFEYIEKGSFYTWESWGLWFGQYSPLISGLRPAGAESTSGHSWPGQPLVAPGRPYWPRVGPSSPYWPLASPTSPWPPKVAPEKSVPDHRRVEQPLLAR